MGTTSVWNFNRSAPAFSSAFFFSSRERRTDVRTEMQKRPCRFPVADFVTFIQIMRYITHMKEIEKTYRILVAKQ
jgi:hypothetical protein